MATTLCWAVWAVASAMVVASILWAYRWSHPKVNGRLPPGSLGLPLLGETMQFFAPNPTCDVSSFVKDRMNRYSFFSNHALAHVAGHCQNSKPNCKQITTCIITLHIRKYDG